MTEKDHEAELAKLNERSTNQGDRLKKLEDNQRWGVLTILALLAKAAFDFFGVAK